jgi:outer membrane receptor for ferrienterochelin and colicin
LLDEVVVVGYGVQKKRDVTTAIASIRASDLKGQPVTSMAEAMVGKMPGVQVSQSTGAPGSSLQIKARCAGRKRQYTDFPFRLPLFLHFCPHLLILKPAVLPSVGKPV